MLVTTAMIVIVIAAAYSLFHSYQAVRLYREQAQKRKTGASVFASRYDDPSAAGAAKDVVPGNSVEASDNVPNIQTLTDSAAAVTETVAAVSTDQTSPSATSPHVPETNQQSLFRDFRGILSDDSGDLFSAPPPEELPVPDEDMVFGPATPMISQLLPESEARRDRQRRNLVAAGYHSRAAWLNLNSIRFSLAFFALLAAGFWLLVASPQTEVFAACSIVLGPLLMWALPPLVVSSKSAERRIDIERGLPDVLDMLNMGVSQGLTVPSSLSRISTEISVVHPDLGRELAIVNQQAQVGTLNHALRNFAQRIDSPEVSSFTSLLMQAEMTGTSISQALADYSDSMRSSHRERADSQANAASFKLLFPTALCLMPSVFLFLLGPAIVDMTDFMANTSSSLLETRTEALEQLDQQPIAVPLDN